MGVEAVMGIDFLLRKLRIIPPIEGENNNSASDAHIDPPEELRIADEQGEMKLRRAAKRIVSVERGEIDEDEFWSLMDYPSGGNLYEDIDGGIDDK